MSVQAVNPSFCGSIYQQAKTLSASVGETLGKVWASVCAFFSSIAQTLGQWMNTAKEGLFAAKDQIVALPRETKVLGAILIGATAGISWIASSFWNKAPAAANSMIVVPGRHDFTEEEIRNARPL